MQCARGSHNSRREPHSGKTEMFTLSSKPRLFPHKLSVWPPCCSVLFGEIEGVGWGGGGCSAQNPVGLLGTGAQDGHLDFHTAPPFS